MNRIVKLAAAGSVALAAMAAPAKAQASSRCLRRCARSHITDTLMVSIAAGVAAVACLPRVISEILCAGGTVIAVTNDAEATKIQCGLTGCGSSYRLLKITVQNRRKD